MQPLAVTDNSWDCPIADIKSLPLPQSLPSPPTYDFAPIGVTFGGVQ